MPQLPEKLQHISFNARLTDDRSIIPKPFTVQSKSNLQNQNQNPNCIRIGFGYLGEKQ
jgi:hypothetical protein